jgi:hypothetical protein
MATSWSRVVVEAKDIIEATVKRLDPLVACDVDGGRGFHNDTVNVVFRKGDARAFAVVTLEAWVNAKADPKELALAFQKVLKALKPNPETVFLVTTRGLKETPLGTEGQVLQEARDWQTFEDEAALQEGDAVAERFFKSKKG